MSASVDFQSQIASIMEVLANAAVAEICKVVDDGYAVVHLEINQSHKDNEFLRRKVKLMELQIARFRAERMKFSEGSANNRFGVRLLNRTPGPTVQSRARLVNKNSANKAAQDRSPINVNHNEPSNHDVVTAKKESIEEQDLDLMIVKVEGAVDDTATSRDPGRALEDNRELTQPSTANEKDVPKPTQPAAINATGRKVTEVSGSHTPAVANNQLEAQIARVTLQAPTGSDLRAERPYMDLNEGDCLIQDPLAREWTDVAANYVSSASYTNIMDVEGAPVCSEPHTVSAIEQHVGQDHAHAQGDVIVIESVSCDQASGRMYKNSEGRGVTEQINSFSSTVGVRELDSITHKSLSINFDSMRTNAQRLSCNSQIAPVFQATERSLLSTGCAASSDIGTINLHKPSYHNTITNQRRFEGPERAQAPLPISHFSQSSQAVMTAHSSQLPVNLRAASVERPFACGICRKKFALESDLRKHCLNHNRQKQFACPVCHKGFISASKLKVHQNVHTGERPFGCRECGRMFSHPSNLRRHQKLQHK